LGAGQGGVEFTVGCDSVNRIATANGRNVRVVRLERLDAVIGNSEPIMIKVDVKGAEEGVLQGARALLVIRCLKVVELETVTSRSAIVLDENQFERAYCDPFCRTPNREPIHIKSSNPLFVRDWSFVSTRLATARRVEVLGRET
jgi:hypothetical protein